MRVLLSNGQMGKSWSRYKHRALRPALHPFPRFGRRRSHHPDFSRLITPATAFVCPGLHSTHRLQGSPRRPCLWPGHGDQLRPAVPTHATVAASLQRTSRRVLKHRHIRAGQGDMATACATPRAFSRNFRQRLSFSAAGAACPAGSHSSGQITGRLGAPARCISPKRSGRGVTRSMTLRSRKQRRCRRRARAL